MKKFQINPTLQDYKVDTIKSPNDFLWNFNDYKTIKDIPEPLQSELKKKYSRIDAFKDGYARVETNNGATTWIDENGELLKLKNGTIIKPGYYSYCIEFNYGYALFNTRDDQYGFITPDKREILIDKSYLLVTGGENGLFIAEKEKHSDAHDVINGEGKVIYDGRLAANMGRNFSDGFLSVVGKDKKRGWLYEKTKDNLHLFQYGKYGFCGDFSEGFARINRISENTKITTHAEKNILGWIDTKGNEYGIGAEDTSLYSFISDFCYGRAMVTTIKGDYGWVDTNFKFHKILGIKKADFPTDTFKLGFIMVEKEGLENNLNPRGYMNLNGEFYPERFYMNGNMNEGIRYGEVVNQLISEKNVEQKTVNILGMIYKYTSYSKSPLEIREADILDGLMFTQSPNILDYVLQYHKEYLKTRHLVYPTVYKKELTNRELLMELSYLDNLIQEAKDRWSKKS